MIPEKLPIGGVFTTSIFGFCCRFPLNHLKFYVCHLTSYEPIAFVHGCKLGFLDRLSGELMLINKLIVGGMILVSVW